ncbi:Nodulation protein D 2 [Gordonia insulae]|uniref:Nodulation protein D 2 n=1 Tax=Gordonia insulae TaxID=2420509 RepID=A0A3G8JML7_9ACTN|nr:Nodulation protein D 2 [Gordonia insulae]
MNEVDLNLLPHLQVLLELKNVSRAAERMHLSQSAMSNNLARLRRHFNDELLVRAGRRYELTTFAETLAPMVDDAVERAQGAMRLNARFDPADSDRTFVVAASDYATAVVMRPLRNLIAELGGHIAVDIMPSARVRPDLEAFNQIDVLIGPVGQNFGGVSRYLFRDEFVVVMDSANPLLQRSRITVDDLARAPHVVGEFGAGVQTPPMRFFAELGLTLRVAARVAGWQAPPMLVEGTDLVALVPRMMVRSIRQHLATTVVEFDSELEIPVVESMYWHPLQATDPANMWLRSMIQRVCRDVDRRMNCPFTTYGSPQSSDTAQIGARPTYRMAMGLTGAPTAPVTGSGAAVSRNSYRLSAAQVSASSSRFHISPM